ncbi:MAG: ATP-dependent Clp protease proteolytic subunit [Planctomycetes bacterium]|nr:ATP-dependent Clp protease proteolytic subunit [Planctomycetota bacterium]
MPWRHPNGERRTWLPRPHDDFRLLQSLLKDRTVRLLGEIDEGKATEVVAQLLFLEEERTRLRVKIALDGGVILRRCARVELLDGIARLPRHRAVSGAAGDVPLKTPSCSWLLAIFYLSRCWWILLA